VAIQLQVAKLETDHFDGEDDHSNEVEKRIERAFAFGAAFAAIDAFSLPEHQRDLFLMNVVGNYRSISEHNRVDFEIKRMVEAANDLEEVSKAGIALMMDYLVNGEQENDKNGLASMMGIET
jgi:hypothetical protein